MTGSADQPQWTLYRKDRYTKSSGSVGYREVKLWSTPAVTEQWVDFVIHVKWTVDDSGYIELYRNQSLVYQAQGIRTMNTDEAESGPYSKWGIYGQPTRILFDEVRIAEGPGQLEAVSP